MIAKGIKVTVLSDRVKGQPTSERVDNIEVLHLNHLMWLPIIQRGKMLDVLEKNNPDVIVWCGKPLSCVSLVQLRFIKKPIVWSLESGVHSLQVLLRLPLRELLSKYHRFLWNEILNALFPRFLIRTIANSSLVKKVVVPSRYLRDWLLGMGVLSGKVTVIQSTLDEYHRSPSLISKDVYKTNLGFQREDFIITYMGSPCTLRGSDTVIRSVPIILANRKSDLKCLILSRGSIDGDFHHLKDEEKYLRELINKLRVGNRVKIIPGMLKKEELVQFMQVSDVIVLPFKLLQSEIPLSVLEAMSLGKVVVTTKIRTLEYIVGKNRGVLVESSDPHQLARAIIEIADGKKDTEMIMKNAQKFTSSLPSWTAIAHKTISILEKAAL
jgi:glycosyltransferase involved in cell wall biosynthesis